MSRLAFIFIFSFFHNNTITAQVKYDYNWALGYDSNTIDSTFGGTDINFNLSPVSINYVYRELDLWFSNTTMSDAIGDLIFYSNGCEIYNKDHELMVNGDSINPGIVHEMYCMDSYPVHQSLVPLPKPGSDSLYYLFHEHLALVTEPIFNLYTDQLMYTIVNMSKDGGRGAVVEKNNVVISDTLAYAELTAVKHSNGEDWWILLPRDTHNVYVSILLKSDTIEGPFMQEVGSSTSRFDRGYGQTGFSPDGTKYARGTRTNELMLFDFDRSTGLLSNYQELMVDDSIGATGVGFSPNSRFLYTGTTWDLYQYDLEADDIQSSQTLIGSWDGFLELGIFSTRFRQFQMGPDCRLYINTVGSTRYLHVIEHPDEKGLACGFVQRGVQLPTWNAFALPLLPNYRLGATPSYPCDSTIVLQIPISTKEVAPSPMPLRVWPNPAFSGSILFLENNLGADGQFILMDVLGNVLLEKEIHGYRQQEEIALPANILTGVYFYTLQSKGRVVASGKLVVE